MTAPRPSYPMIPAALLRQYCIDDGVQDVDGVTKLLTRIMDKQAIDERANYLQIQKDIANVPTGAAATFDAVVDSTLSASSPSTRQFLNIGEAMEYLRGTVGLTKVAIAVKAGTYTETTNVLSGLVAVRLFAMPAADAFWATPSVNWNVNGKAIRASNITMDGFRVTAGAAQPIFTGTPGMVATDCKFVGTASSKSVGVSPAVFINCLCQDIEAGASEWYMIGGAFQAQLGTFTFQGSGTPRHWLFEGTNFSLVGNTIDLTVVQSLSMHGVTFDDGYGLGTNNTSGQVNIGGSTQVVSWYGGSNHNGNHPSLSLANPSSAVIVGDFTTVTITNTNQGPIYFSGNVEGVLDVTGPARIDVAMNAVGQDGQVLLRGSAINADIDIRYTNPTTGTAIKGLSLVDSRIDVAATLGVASSSQKAYSEDASSARNIVDIAGSTRFPTASTFQASTLSRTT